MCCLRQGLRHIATAAQAMNGIRSGLNSLLSFSLASYFHSSFLPTAPNRGGSH